MTQPVNMQQPQAYVPQVQPMQAPPAPVVQQAPAQAVSQGYYSYPASNFYQYPQAASCPVQPQANAVNINIINPQAYTGSPAAQPMAPAPMPAQYVQMPPAMQPMPPQVAYDPQAVPPAPVITPTEAAPAAAPAVPAEPPTVTPPQAPAPAVDLQAFNARLRGENLEDQGAVMEEMAEITQANPQMAVAFLDTQVMEGLLSVIAKDTTGLQGPTPKQLELRQNMINGKQLTPAETAEANTITPMEIAERNKQYSLYTIAFLQNLLSSEVEKRNGIKLDIKDLPCIEQVVQTAKSDPNPLVRESAISALSHITKPEYKPVLTTIFELAKADAAPNVKDAAEKALAQLNGTAQAAPTAQAA